MVGIDLVYSVILIFRDRIAQDGTCNSFKQVINPYSCLCRFGISRVHTVVV